MTSVAGQVVHLKHIHYRFPVSAAVRVIGYILSPLIREDAFAGAAFVGSLEEVEDFISNRDSSAAACRSFHAANEEFIFKVNVCFLNFH